MSKGRSKWYLQLSNRGIGRWNQTFLGRRNDERGKGMDTSCNVGNPVSILGKSKLQWGDQVVEQIAQRYCELCSWKYSKSHRYRQPGLSWPSFEQGIVSDDCQRCLHSVLLCFYKCCSFYILCSFLSLKHIWTVLYVFRNCWVCCHLLTQMRNGKVVKERVW